MFGASQRKPVNKSQQGQVVSRPAPIGGWNAKDPLANMPTTDAVTMTNWWPTPGSVQVRNGYSQYATGFPSIVETLAPYRGNTQNNFFACSGGNIYDISVAGAIGAAVQSGLSSNRWNYVNYTTTGGTRYLTMFNGSDSPRYWDGAAWTTITGVSTPAITFTTGATPDLIFNCTSHKSRLWLLRKNSLEAYYLPVGAVGGAASLFDLRPVFKLGGNLLDVETWSIDTGVGADDRIVFVSDQGEIVIYQGSDPSSAQTWSLAGVYNVGSAIGPRSLSKFGGDVVLICQFGLLPLSSIVQSKIVNVSETLTDKIQFAISNAVSAYGSNFGWQTFSYPKTNMLLLNIPTSSTTFEQYAMNTITGAWCHFTGWNGECWALWNDDPYFGGSTFVGKAWDTYSDNGTAISTDLKTAFDYLGSPGQLKQFLMARPTIGSNGNPGIAYGINIDFDDSNVIGVPSFAPSTSGSWDSAVWDTGVWGSDSLTIQKNWQYASGLGYCGAFRMTTLSSGIQVTLNAIDYLFVPGGVL